jgi:hypothetical protein
MSSQSISDNRCVLKPSSSEVISRYLGSVLTQVALKVFPRFPSNVKEEIVQGGSKVLRTFVFLLSSMSLEAQKKYYRQIKAEIMKFI